MIRSLIILEELVHLIAEECQRDTTAMRFAARERLGHLQRLIELHPRRHRRLIRIHNRFHERGTPGLQRGLQRALHLVWLLASESDSAARFGEPYKVDRLELDAILGIAEEHHL